MSQQPPVRPSEEELWAGPMGEKWLANLARFEGMIEPVGAALIAAAAFAPGERVLDVGCGAGATSLEIARRVGPGGRVTGLDISPVLIEAGRQRAAAAALANLAFVAGDAARVELEPAGYDCLFSRFGTMFFGDPYAAFAHLHGCLRPTGRLALACWAPPAQNQWMLELRAIMAKHVALPPPVPRAPGPFAYDDPAYLGDILGKAGFHSAKFALWQGEQFIGGPGSDPIAAAQFLLEATPMGEAIAGAPEIARAMVRDEVITMLERHDGLGGVRMAAAAWLVTALA